MSTDRSSVDQNVQNVFLSHRKDPEFFAGPLKTESLEFNSDSMSPNVEMKIAFFLLRGGNLEARKPNVV